MDNKKIQEKAAPHTPKTPKAAVAGTLKRVNGFVILTSPALENHVGDEITVKADGKEITATIRKHALGNSAVLEDSDDLLSLFANGDHDVTASI